MTQTQGLDRGVKLLNSEAQTSFSEGQTRRFGPQSESFLNQASVFLNQFLLTVAGKANGYLGVVAGTFPSENEPPAVFGVADVRARKEVRSGLVSGRRLI